MRIAFKQLNQCKVNRYDKNQLINMKMFINFLSRMEWTNFTRNVHIYQKLLV